MPIWEIGNLPPAEPFNGPRYRVTTGLLRMANAALEAKKRMQICPEPRELQSCVELLTITQGPVRSAGSIEVFGTWGVEGSSANDLARSGRFEYGEMNENGARWVTDLQTGHRVLLVIQGHINEMTEDEILESFER